MDASIARADVAICGASFAGLALAIALAKAGDGAVSIVVVDRGKPMNQDEWDPRAVAVSQSSVRMLDMLGVWSEVAGEAQAISRIEITDSPLDAGIRPVLLAWDNEIDGEAASHIVPTAALEAALMAAAAAQPGVSIRNEVDVGGFETGPFAAEMTGPGGRPIVSAALLVAADGRGSVLRKAAGLKSVGWDYRQSGIVTRIRHERPHEGIAIQHFLPSGPFALLPLRDDRSCITWTEDETRAAALIGLDDEGFLAEIDLRLGGRVGRIWLDGARRSFPLSVHLARRYVARRLALAGDAAHGVHPLAGQGLNLALRDAAALAECVIEGMRQGLDAGDAFALERYEKWRRFDSWLAASTFDALNRLFGGEHTLVRSARETALQVVDRLPGVKRMLMREAAGVVGDLPRLLKGEPI